MLLRDRMGVKPLYYAWDGTAFWFGSELKALRAFAAWKPEIDRDALGEYLQFGYVSAPRSIYRGVSKLMPGHWLELGEIGEPVAHRYWAPDVDAEPLEGSEEELEQRLESILVDAFRYRMVSDVPVGVFLSGGVDSSLVAALLQRYGGGDVRTFTIGFDDERFDESGHAKAVAAHLGTRHCESVVRASDMAGVLAQWGDLFDEPFGDTSGVPTYLVSSMAREHVKVALSADGGDELFSGYSHYGVVLERHRALARWPPRFAGPPRCRSARSAAGAREAIADRLPLPAGKRHAARARAAGALREALRDAARARRPDDLRPRDVALDAVGDLRAAGRRHAAARARRGARRLRRPDVVHCDLRHYLPDDILAKVDRTTMAAGLEGREPLLDHRLVEFALRLPLNHAARAARHQAPAAQDPLPPRAARADRPPEAGLRDPARDLAARRAGAAHRRIPVDPRGCAPAACSTRTPSGAPSRTSARAGPATTGSTCRKCGCSSPSRCGASRWDEG